MRHWFSKKEWKRSVHTLIIIILSIVFYKFMDNMNGLYSSIYEKLVIFIDACKPFLLAVVIAYIFNPIVKWVERKVVGQVLSKERQKYNRMISTVCVFILFILMIVLILVHGIPRISMSIKDLLSSLPNFVYDHQNKIIDWVHNLYKNDVYNIAPTIEKNINHLFLNISKIFQGILNNILDSVIELTSKTLNIFVTLIASFYILIDKDSLIKGLEKILRALFKEDHIESLKNFSKEADTIFVKFVIGKSIDSFIIGVMAFVGLSLMKSPYILLISLIVGITNMIPYFGPLIGEIVGFIFVSFYSPIKALWVLLFLAILQQFDSFYLGPKILGDKMGISPLWIIFSIALGGSLFGIIGMFLGVPAISVIIVVVRRFVDKRLEMKNQIKLQK
ncbi:AI-2E family transporter [Inediibacterium massiliense]|uniref:AI-2E family transporter n=1 Tax=Inediibacterium massiliense TaxID=1658111 RepID=UPI0006B4F271|nr:AI-2E family transporter [Inediibacterium massiliense]